MKHKLFFPAMGAVLFVLCTANYLSFADQSHQPLNNLSREEIFKRLTKNKWIDRDPAKAQKTTNTEPLGFMPFDFGWNYSLTLRPDGTYSWTQASDAVPQPSDAGKWNFEQNAAGDWFLLFDNGKRQRFTMNEDGSLTLDLDLWKLALYPGKPITDDQLFTADTLPSLPMNPGLVSVIDRLTAQKWKRANDLNLNREPTRIEFRKDWSYVATYRNNECENKGWWYAALVDKQFEEKHDRSLKGVDVMVRAASPLHTCYQQEGDNSVRTEHFKGKLLDNGFLWLGYDLYVPEDYQLEKGVIGEILGYSDVVRIKVTYDMPIRAGVANNFEVEVTNLGERRYNNPITLQRFSVTEDYAIRDYRQTNNYEIAHAEEIAGKDLGLKQLKVGETYTFSLEVTFKKRGKQKFYLNALMYGPTQKWDTVQHYSCIVE